MFKKNPGDLNVLCGIMNTIRDFSDREYQKRVWIDTDGVDWYLEAFVSLLDDYRLEDFASMPVGTYGLGATELQSLKIFLSTLLRFDELYNAELPDDVIVSAPEWNGVVSAAAEVIKVSRSWIEEHCDASGMGAIDG